MLQKDSAMISPCDCIEDLTSIKRCVENIKTNFTQRNLIMTNLMTFVCFGILMLPISFYSEGLVIAITLLLTMGVVSCICVYCNALTILETDLKDFDDNVKKMTINKPIANIKHMLLSFYIMQLLNKAGALGMIIGIIMLANIIDVPGAITGYF